MNARLSKGDSIAELPVALFFFLALVFFPLLDLGTIFFGASQVYSACRTAAVAAGKAPSLINDTNVQTGAPPNVVNELKPSATNTAKQLLAKASGGGINVQLANPIKVFQQSINANPDGSLPQATLFQPAPGNPIDQANYVYQIEVDVIGSVKPLVLLSTSLFGQVPGVTVPVTINTSSIVRFENAKGLNN